MKRNSIITSVVLLGVVCFVVIGGFLLWFSARTFENEITRLNRRDYGERIRNIEYEYEAVDAVTTASPEVYEAQEDLLSRLRERYDFGAAEVSQEEGSGDGRSGGGRTAYPFIMNGDKEVILHLEQSPVSEEFFASDVADRIIETGEGSFSFLYEGTNLWVVFRYFEPWDWITGYMMTNEQRLEALRSFLGSFIVALVVALLVVAVVFWAYVRRSLSPLGRLSSAMSELVDGNLRDRLTPRGKNEISTVTARFNDFADRLASIIETIRDAAKENEEIGNRLQTHSEQSLEAAEHIKAQSAEMEQAADGLNDLVDKSAERMEQVRNQVSRLDEAIDEQFAAVTQSTAAAEQMSASLDNVARITREKTETSQRLKETVRDGGEKLAATREIITDVNGRIDDISELLSIIQNVAAQTNLLSMNAAIEAAHAGEAGKGFAVVADEIRKLAEESSENSASISEIIRAVIDRIRSIADSSQQTGQAFESIEAEVGEVLQSFGEISQSADELATGSTQIRTSMSSLKDISTRVKEGSGDSLTAAKEIEESLGEISERASRILEGIGSVNEQSGGSVEAVRKIKEEAQALRASVASLNRTIRGFEL